VPTARRIRKRGQTLIGNQAELGAIRADVEGEMTQAGFVKALGANLKPIPVDAELLGFLDQTKRLEFLKQWQVAIKAGKSMRAALPRVGVVGLTALAAFLPLGLIFYQSLINAPFFIPNRLSLGAFDFIFAEGDFWDALRNSLVIAGGMVIIAVPLGGILAFAGRPGQPR
jgi:hypothetical protein